jgi:hypothetical protein
MAFADLKNDFVFRRIFAMHPDILRSLLNDLLERTGEQTIEAIEYLPSEQLPLVVGAKLTEVPPHLPPGPHREAMELANKATFTQEELDAYQKVIDEIEQVRELAEAKWAEGRKSGLVEGELKAKRDALLRLLARGGIVLSDDDRARILECADAATLDGWFDKALGAKTAAEVFC